MAKVNKKEPHKMFSEIFEQPAVLADIIGSRILAGKVVFPELSKARIKPGTKKRMIFVGCGTAFHAALYGKYLFEEMLGWPVDAVVASEFAQQKMNVPRGTVVLAISQSGETADTINALKKAKKLGLKTVALVNDIDSSIARMVDAAIDVNAGEERAIASTKAYTAQLLNLFLLAIYFHPLGAKKFDYALKKLPAQIMEILKNEAEIKKIAKKYHKISDFVYLGREFSYPTAMEGALKLKETTYVHAEAMPAGEIKHGPVAMIDKKFPIIFVIPKNDGYRINISLAKDLNKRGCRILAVATAGDKQVFRCSEAILNSPKTIEYFEPIVSIIPLQFLAYHIAVMKGLNVDKPRGLTKAVRK